MKRCKHAGATGMIKHLRLPDGRSCNSLRSKCFDCSAWLSLGPSNDSIPAAESHLAELLAVIAQVYTPRTVDGAMETAVANCAEACR